MPVERVAPSIYTGVLNQRAAFPLRLSDHSQIAKKETDQARYQCNEPKGGCRFTHCIVHQGKASKEGQHRCVPPR